MRRWSVVVGLVVGTVVAIVVAVRGVSAREPRLEAFANARSDRLFDARLSGAFAHRPFAHRRAAASDDDWRLAALLADGTQNLRERGRANLLAGRTAKAIAAFEEALHNETGENDPARGIARSSNAALLSDLSAAYYTDATENRGAWALPAAIECAQRAIQLDAASSAALWNRALALQALGVLDDARASWDAYLQRDSDSAWADEARRRRGELDRRTDETLWPAAREQLLAAARSGDAAAMRQVVARFPMRSAGLVERELLPGPDRVIAQRASEAIADTHHDPLLLEVSRDLRPEVAALFRTAPSLDELQRARDTANRLRSPVGIRLTLQLALRRYELRDHRAALAELDTLSDPMLRRYPVSLAQAHWYRGLAEASLGYATDALESYAAAASIYQSIGDEGLAGTMALMRADAAEYAGDFEQAWSSYAVAMHDLTLHGNTTMRDNATSCIVRSALRRGYPNTALILQSRSIDRLRGVSKPEYLCQALIARCDTYARLGSEALARHDCREAALLFATLTDAAARARLESDLHVAAAGAEASSGQSLEPLTAALHVAVRDDDHFRIARLYLARARAFLAQRRDTEAERDLCSASAEIERQRQRLSSDEFRVMWLDASRAAHEELVALLLRTKRFDDAFEVADGARARVALDRLGAGETGLVLPRLRAALPPDAAFVELWVSANEEVVTWVITRERTTCRRFMLRGLARRVRETLEQYAFDDLVQPWLGDVRGRRLLFISADSLLAGVPFGALRDQTRNTRLVAEHVIVMEPSAAVFSSRANVATAWDSAVVIVGDTIAGQAPLATEREANAVREAGFRNTQVLCGPDATPARVLELAPNFDVVHFAGHAVETARQEAALVLQADGRHADGLLRSTELERARVPQGALVVLAACRTSRGRNSSDGSLSLVRSFLLTGSTAVIGSLWDVDDEATGRLFSIFYRQLAQHRAPADALRLAQLEISKTDPDPHDWAAFQIHGGAF